MGCVGKARLREGGVVYRGEAGGFYSPVGSGRTLQNPALLAFLQL